ncbi:hypothetical protein [Mariniluteicoccus flavus]
MTRIRAVLVALLAACLLVASCTRAPDRPPSDGLVDAGDWAARQKAYLQIATERIDPNSLDSLIAATGRARGEAGFAWDARKVTTAGLAPVLAKVEQHRDTSDFDLMRLWVLWHDARDELPAPVRDALQARILGYRYWYTDPQPRDGVDHKWFWSENHRIIAHTLEYLAGKDFADTRFAVSGEPGRVHADRGRQRILAWLDEKARWGFSEWHSDVYYLADIEALVLLAEHGDDEVSGRASAMLDSMLLDLALHQFKGNMGSTHGRSYMKDKARSETQDVHNLIQFLFATSPEGYTPTPDFASLLFATSTRYRLPEAIRRVATDPATMTDRERMGVHLDLTAPFGEATPPPGTSFTDPNALAFWWDRGAMTAWPIVPLSLQAIREHRLWTTDLFSPLGPLLKRGDVQNPMAAQYAAYALGCQINQGLLTRANTVTHRTADAMLSSVQDYRAGCFGRQYHAWQATLGSDAVVFTTHPGNSDQGRWDDRDLYWNGGVTMPRVAQSNGALIAVYAPAYASGEGDEANFLAMTHAYFPTEKFDEVRQVGHWVFGRKGDGYVALWSHREAEFRDPGPNPAGLKKRYDLVAIGGADNVWISEVGQKARWGSFDAFVEAHRAAPVRVTPRPERAPGVPGGFEVAYVSPAERQLEFGTEGPFRVAGREVALHPAPRMDNPYATVGPEQPAMTVTAGDQRWSMDLATGRRGPG